MRRFLLAVLGVAVVAGVAQAGPVCDFLAGVREARQTRHGGGCQAVQSSGGCGVTFAPPVQYAPQPAYYATGPVRQAVGGAVYGVGQSVSGVGTAIQTTGFSRPVYGTCSNGQCGR